MKLAGHVHRDVSPGNFLLHYLKKNGALPDPASISQTAREDWVTIISDLEFARPYLDAPKDDQNPVRYSSMHRPAFLDLHMHRVPRSTLLSKCIIRDTVSSQSMNSNLA